MRFNSRWCFESCLQKWNYWKLLYPRKSPTVGYVFGTISLFEDLSHTWDSVSSDWSHLGIKSTQFWVSINIPLHFLGHKKGKDRLVCAETAVPPLGLHCNSIKLKGNLALCKLTLGFSSLLGFFNGEQRCCAIWQFIFMTGSILSAKEACWINVQNVKSQRGKK